MVKKLFITGLVFLNVGMYGMDWQKTTWKKPESPEDYLGFTPSFYPTVQQKAHVSVNHEVFQDKLSFQQSLVAHDYRAHLDEKNRDLFRLKKKQINAMWLEKHQKAEELSVFGKHIVAHCAKQNAGVAKNSTPKI
ncbi:MAG: hypothetical protein ACHQVS_02435 [Candidatus Babeliales bacterium]